MQSVPTLCVRACVRVCVHMCVHACVYMCMCIILIGLMEICKHPTYQTYYNSTYKSRNDTDTHTNLLNVPGRNDTGYGSFLNRFVVRLHLLYFCLRHQLRKYVKGVSLIDVVIENIEHASVINIVSTKE